MHDSIPIYFKALFVVTVIALLAEFFLGLVPVLKKYHIPRAFVGGLIALLAGPQVLGNIHNLNIISQDIQNSWNELALFFVNVVFACIFLGKVIPSFKKSMSLAIPQIAMGQTLAWGQYLIGGLITLFVLIPFFNIDESAASFIEISFEGGVGVAVGMNETFKSIGFDDAKSITVALAPLAMLTGIISGVLLINYKSRHHTIHLEERDQKEKKKRKIKRTKYQNSFIIQFAIIGIAILLGQLLLYLLQLIENTVLLGDLYNKGFVEFIPLFPMALMGGALLQLFINRIIPLKITNGSTIKRIQTISLEAVIIMAIGTIDLSVIKENMILILILLIAGFLWNISCFLLTHKILIPNYAFERGIADYGQSMGTTSIGLMFQSIVDKQNKSKGKEAFALKQLLFEPFVGGGIITALSPVLIKKVGLVYFTGMSFILTLIFFLSGYLYKRYKLQETQSDN